MGSKHMRADTSLLLGTAGDLLVAEEARSHYLTKVGGAAWVPASGGASCSHHCNWDAASLCGACGRCLSLVLQAFAPVSKEEAKLSGALASDERVLLLLGCAHPGCGSSPASWRAFRCQLRNRSSEALEEAEAGQQAECTGTAAQARCTTNAPTASADPYGGGFSGGFLSSNDAFSADVGFDAGFSVEASGGGAAGVDLDFSDLGAALEECASKPQQQQQAQQAARKGASSCAGQDGHGPACAQPCASEELELSGPSLPEFHILAAEERAAAAGAACRKEQEHVQRLLEEYERQERASAVGRAPQAAQQQPSRGAACVAPGSAGAGSARGAPPLRGGQSAANGGIGSDGSDDGGSSAADAGEHTAPSGGEAGSDAESWAGEEYEEDHVRGVDGAYLKFAARLSRQPDQCARYGRRCDLLWPTRSAPAPPPCPRCGSPRAFELQIMAPLIAIVLECADWLEGPDLERHRSAINAAGNWDFVTVAVFTCTANCCGSAMGAAAAEGGGCRELPVEGLFMTEEYVAYVNEDQCHVPDELKPAK